MRKFTLILALLFGFSAAAQIPSGYVQTTATVSALANGSFGAAWTNLSSSPQLGLLGCVSTFQQTVNGTFNGSGQMSVLLADTSQICPSPSTWTFTFTFSCPVGQPPSSFQIQVPVTGGGGTENISSQISTALPSTSCSGGGGGSGCTPTASAFQILYYSSSGTPCAGATLTTDSTRQNIYVPGTAYGGTFQGKGTGFLVGKPSYIFGDSITANSCVGVPQANCWANISQTQTGFNNPSNYGVSGDQAADQVFNQMYPNLNTHYYSGTQGISFVGVNDANVCVVTDGGSTGCYNNYFHTYLSGVAWGVIPLENKIIPQLGISTGNCTTAGTWINETYQTNVAAIESVVPGSTITCTTLDPNATGLYVNWAANDSWTSAATLAIDGTQVDTLDGFGFNGQTIRTYNGLTQAPFASRYNLVPGTTHTFTVTVTTAGSGNPFEFLWAGSPTTSTPQSFANITQNPPAWGLGGVIYQNQTTANATASAAMNVQAQLVATTLAGDGAQVTFIPVRNFENATTDFTSGTETLPNGQSYCGSTGYPIHPNCLGQQHISDATVATLLPIGTGFPTTITSASSGVQFTVQSTLNTSGGYAIFNMNRTNSGANAVVRYQLAGVDQWYAGQDSNCGFDYSIINIVSATPYCFFSAQNSAVNNVAIIYSPSLSGFINWDYVRQGTGGGTALRFGTGTFNSYSPDWALVEPSGGSTFCIYDYLLTGGAGCVLNFDSTTGAILQGTLLQKATTPQYESFDSGSTAQGFFGQFSNTTSFSVNRSIGGTFTDTSKTAADILLNSTSGGTTSNVQMQVNATANTTPTTVATFDNTGENICAGCTYKVNGTAIQQANPGSGTYTTAASDSFTVIGATAASHCTFSPTNATAAAATVVGYISAVGTNSVTITHVATSASGGTIDILCTAN